MDHTLILEDMPAVQDLLCALTAEAFPKTSLWRASHLAQAHTLASQHMFDLALVDLSLPDGLGTDLIARLAQEQPHCRIIVATIHDDDNHLFQALKAGAHGYLLKDESREALLHHLQGIPHGLLPMSASIARRLQQHFLPERPSTAGPVVALSEREREVLALLAQGIRLQDIADTLGISRFTVGDHVKNIYRKLNISSRAEAALKARSIGLI